MSADSYQTAIYNVVRNLASNLAQNTAAVQEIPQALVPTNIALERIAIAVERIADVLDNVCNSSDDQSLHVNINEMPWITVETRGA
jgi:hypothetical protein